MRDAESKLNFLVQFTTVVRDACEALPDDEAARVFARAEFLALENFLKFARYLKNRPHVQAHLNGARSFDALRGQLDELTGDYESIYASIRNDNVAHRVNVDLVKLMQYWSEIDFRSLSRHHARMVAIYDAIATAARMRPFSHAPAASLQESLRRLPRAVSERPRFDMSLVATGPTVIPCHPSQEKAQRILTIIDSIWALSRIYAALSPSALARFGNVALFVVDLCNLLDNLFGWIRSDPGDPSLLTHWRALDNHESLRVVAEFRRRKPIERAIKQARDGIFAHIDEKLPLPAILDQYNRLPLPEIAKYAQSLIRTIYRAFQSSMQTRLYSFHGEEMPDSAVSVYTHGEIKGFRE